MSRDIHSLNFICHGDDTQLVLFYYNWQPLQMDKFLDDILKDQNYSINITAPVITRRDNLDIKDTIALIEHQIQEKVLQPEIEINIPKAKVFSEFQDQPVEYQTRSSRRIQKPGKY